MSTLSSSVLELDLADLFVKNFYALLLTLGVLLFSAILMSLVFWPLLFGGIRTSKTKIKRVDSVTVTTKKI